MGLGRNTFIHGFIIIMNVAIITTIIITINNVETELNVPFTPAGVESAPAFDQQRAVLPWK